MNDTQDKTPIRALIEAVEHNGDVNRSLPWSIALGVSDGMTARAAYNGSLDAAKALHDALLPGWGLVINVSKDFASTRKDTDIGLMEDAFFPCSSDNPARAALLAILRAYEAQQ